MKKTYCCESMAYFAEYKCDVHENSFDCPDCIIYAKPKEELFGIIVHDGGQSFIQIHHCPWCGKKLD